jgi:4-aminobutyrate aminotransferase-like enzyme
VLISSAGPHGNVLKIRPPLVFSTEHADLLVERLDQALAELGLMAEE